MSKYRKRDQEDSPDRHRSNKERDNQASQQSEIIRNLVTENAEKSSENRKIKMLLEKTNKELIQARKSTLDAERIIDGTKEALDKVKEALTKQTEGIKNSLVCGICEEHCMPPLKACACGVVVCDYCISKGPTKKCFFCRNDAPRTRNLKLEHLAAEIEFACPGCGPDRTCGDKFLYKDATEHTNVCPRTFLLLCPIDGCHKSAGFNTTEIKQHMLKEHAIECNTCLKLPKDHIWEENGHLTIDVKNSAEVYGQTDTKDFLVETLHGIALIIQNIGPDSFSSRIYHFSDPGHDHQARFKYTLISRCGNFEDSSSFTIIKFLEMPRWNGFLCDKSETEIKAIKQVGMAILELEQKRITKFSDEGVLRMDIEFIVTKEDNSIQNDDDRYSEISPASSPVNSDIFGMNAEPTSPNLEGSSDDE